MLDIPAEKLPPGFTLHHMGVAVADLETALNFYSSVLGLRILSPAVDDPIQKVRVCFLAEPGRERPSIELIHPLGDDSPVNSYLKKGCGAYHLCYEVSDISGTLAELRRMGCLTISPPVPAVAFGGRKIAWSFTPTRHLLELLEKESP
jgi:methylmalonyl-CoA/ethylmalonyl-CoA epimerase